MNLPKQIFAALIVSLSCIATAYGQCTSSNEIGVSFGSKDWEQDSEQSDVTYGKPSTGVVSPTADKDSSMAEGMLYVYNLSGRLILSANADGQYPLIHYVANLNPDTYLVVNNGMVYKIAKH